jgi:hypothetical protein
MKLHLSRKFIYSFVRVIKFAEAAGVVLESNYH